MYKDAKVVSIPDSFSVLGKPGASVGLHRRKYLSYILICKSVTRGEGTRTNKQCCCSCCFCHRSSVSGRISQDDC